ncbi:hypothetical protein E8E13_009539 [Curvularia kusanoi]|uniref:L-ascorbate oxidase n=1 Tax=Curvularia kusanoi TaxID=90978 RepID=A0A9P4WBH7_CURKU|nr:hypothetical protein E8E13_009539 [Curvularia kusanoi]
MLSSLLSVLFAAFVAASNTTKPANATHLYTHDANFTPDFYLSVTYQIQNVACQQRMSALVNGTSPGPELRLKPGKTSWVRVCNDMDAYNLTMHWHGLSQRTAPFSDGSPVSQWPIAPHQCFDYEIHPEVDDAGGTYFYHSHVGFQAVSAAGPLIIEDDAPPYQYDEERIIFLQDYFNKTDDVIEEGLTATPFVWSGEVNAVLVNGVGIAKDVTTGREKCALPIIDVEPDKTYRLRFIGSLALSMVSFGIENHTDLQVINVDGHYTKLHPVDHLQVTSGQRYDVLLKTKCAEDMGGKTSWTIKFETKDRPSSFTGFGILRYSGGSGPGPANFNPSITPLQLSNDTTNYLEYALEPLVPNGFPTTAEVTRRVHITNQQLLDSTIIWQMNGVNFTDDTPYNSPPYLVDIYKNGPSAMPNYSAALENGGWDPHTLAWPAKIGEVLEIIIENTGSDVNDNGGLDYHPFHMHGGHYYDCGSGQGVFDAAANEKKLSNYNPVLRDTTNLYKYAAKTDAGERDGWRCWRLRVQDAGCWMLHCHILQHMIMGMQSVWIMGDYEQIARIPYSGAEGYLEYGGTAYGGEDISPIVWHEWDD